MNCTITSLTVQSLSTTDDVVALCSGLSSNSSLQQLTIHSLAAEGVSLVANTLAIGTLAGKLLQLRLPSSR